MIRTKSDKKNAKTNNSDSYPRFEFHISRDARDRYKFDESLFSSEGEVIFGNFADSQHLAALLNADKAGEEYLSAAELYAMGLLDEIAHFIIEAYRRQINPRLLRQIENELAKKYGADKVDLLLKSFLNNFPPQTVYNGEQSEEDYLKGKSGDLTAREISLEEVIVLWLDNRNPAYQPIKEMISEETLQKETIYAQIFDDLEAFFRRLPGFGPDNLPLLEMLQMPARLYPHSLTAQLQFIREHWQDLIEPLLTRILIRMDFIREEEKARLAAAFGGPGPTQVIAFDEDEFEEERFSADLDWMPRLVLIAKSTYVWLDQLSKKYERPITRLDQVPDEELDRLARAGFSGLWLIGIWERSRASQRIKQMTGNPEAMASAYSLDRYEIARDLGGEEAFLNLRHRAMRRGIRMGSDMVPNHMGIDSQWVIHHPDWFVQMDHPPFPTYSFTGPDLCDDERVGIFIEDGYWNRSDAAVVFKRLDRHTGEVRYIYHGNDGTSMPWNDTAQLNYLLAEVREAVIQTILEVARKFPIIRFDAAMTLAKKHYQRLWFPEPGKGGDIPSRALFAMSKEEFNRAFPTEFWREVVDRVQQEVPDTLLLAEAFWLMESFFVRTLGMHRVYNSAFMNMLKNEENDKYRLSVKNVLEFNPQILKRYVNFMNNPDEETAVAQFGKGDKYFGVCVMMCTMPGLPMFGHGQIEGYEEKYGMEYRRAYWDEQADAELMARHEREIFPLLRQRRRFADVEHFYLYDFYRPDGSVNENVFAYSNGNGEDVSLVVYHNKYEETEGWINLSSGVYRQESLERKTLAEALQIDDDPDLFVCFKDMISGLEYLRPAAQLCAEGLRLFLPAYRYHVFVDFHHLRRSNTRPYDKLYDRIHEQGVPSIEEALDDLLYEPLYIALQEAVNPGSLRWLADGWKKGRKNRQVLLTFEEKITLLLEAFASFDHLTVARNKIIDSAQKEYLATLRAIQPALKKDAALPVYVRKAVSALFSDPPNDALDGWRILLSLPFLHGLRHLYGDKTGSTLPRYKLQKAFARAWQELPLENGAEEADYLLIDILSEYRRGLLVDEQHPAHIFFEDLFGYASTIRFLGINLFEGVVYFNKERFETLMRWLFILRYIELTKLQKSKKGQRYPGLHKLHKFVQDIIKLAGKTGYRKDDFLKELGGIDLH
ncbi:MAG TPA: alpha-amylase [Caldithrix abyssi]|uniref:Alpha-amylase n=1 Tax=Caldithrix abyssi TaxID=187145 RepID=A0A7V4WU80_CALAY|nr:alpha-amylase [Caldithrix abyssi]